MKIYKATVANELIWADIMKFYWIEILRGEDISENCQFSNYYILSIDFRARCFLVTKSPEKLKKLNGKSKSPYLICIRFSPYSPNASFYQEGYNDEITQFCGYCGIEYKLNEFGGSHGCGCEKKEYQIEVDAKNTIHDNIEIINQWSTITRLENEKKPSYLRVDKSILESLAEIDNIEPQQSIPKSEFSYQIEISRRRVSMGKKFGRKTVLWLDMSRVFKPKDTEALIIAKRMKHLRKTLLITDLRSFVNSVKDIREFMDHRMTSRTAIRSVIREELVESQSLFGALDSMILEKTKRMRSSRLEEKEAPEKKRKH